MRVTNLYPECAGLVGRLFGHRFEARYDEREAKGEFNNIEDGDALRNLSYYDVYVHDVCVRCGCVVHRGPAAGETTDGGGKD
jgi:hypothetical protein